MILVYFILFVVRRGGMAQTNLVAAQRKFVDEEAKYWEKNDSGNLFRHSWGGVNYYKKERDELLPSYRQGCIS